MIATELPPGKPSLACRFWATPPGAEWAALFVGDRGCLVAGRLSEVTLCGVAWWRVEIPDGPNGAVQVRIFHPAQVREIQPCSETRVRIVAALQPRSVPFGPSTGGGADGEPF